MYHNNLIKLIFKRLTLGSIDISVQEQFQSIQSQDLSNYSTKLTQCFCLCGQSLRAPAIRIDVVRSETVPDIAGTVGNTSTSASVVENITVVFDENVRLPSAILITYL